MMEVRGTLPPNRCRELLLGSLSELRGAGTCHGAHGSNTKIPRPFSERAGGEEPPAFPQHSQQPQDPQAGRCPPSHHSGHSSCSGGSNPKLRSPNLIPTRLLKTQHPPGTGWELTDPMGSNSLLLDHAAIPQPHPGGSPRTHPHGHSPAQGLQTLAA